MANIYAEHTPNNARAGDPAMHRWMKTGRAQSWTIVIACFGLIGVAIAGSAAATPKKSAAPSAVPPEIQAAPIPAEAWLSASTARIQPGEIDRLIAAELRNRKIEPAPLTTDEQFIRRLTLDLTGQLPMPADVTEFVADRDPRKRARLIDKLLDSDEYAEHWAHYWRDVIAARLSDFRGQFLVRPFDLWLTKELKANRSWAEITRAMITSYGPSRFDEPEKSGANFFLLSKLGADANVERAAETSRVFLGIQIQCAQCHDHPSDVWKRQQFHDLVAYYSRLQFRPIRDGMRLVGFNLVSAPFGEYQMPDKADPKKRTLTHPRFLDGESPGRRLGDQARRNALADSIVSKKNYWFSAAFANRIWGELMGQGFYQPIDDMGPQKDAVLGNVLTRLAGSFRGSDYNIRELFRAMLNTEAYQRQIRLGDVGGDHLQFAASYPTRLKADVLWQSLVNVLGRIGPPPRVGPQRGPFAFLGTPEGLFKQEFAFDPSLKPDEVEGSVPQALMMMNSPALNQRIQARGTNLLARILKAYPDDNDAIRMVFLRSFARKPTDRELAKARSYINSVGNRPEAFEDLLWALLNSTEFQTKR
jgi:hypothetical protein